MPGELIHIGVGKGIGEIADEAREIYALEKRSDAVKRIMRDWKWGRQKGSKSEKMDQMLRNQLLILGLIVPGRVDDKAIEMIKRATDDTMAMLVDKDEEDQSSD